MIRTYQANLGALERHVPGAFSGRVLLCMAAETASETPDAVRTALGWTPFCGTPPDVRSVPGRHRTMVFEPDVEGVAAQLLEELRLTDQDFR